MDKDVEAPTNAAELSSSYGMRPIDDAEKQTGDADAEAGEVKVPVQVNPMDPSQFPDGGAKAWTVVFGAACGLVVSFGWINCQFSTSCDKRNSNSVSLGIGVFQEYYETHQLKEYSSQEVAWIPSLEAFMMFVGGLWVGRIYGTFASKPVDSKRADQSFDFRLFN